MLTLWLPGEGSLEVEAAGWAGEEDGGGGGGVGVVEDAGGAGDVVAVEEVEEADLEAPAVGVLASGGEVEEEMGAEG